MRVARVIATGSLVGNPGLAEAVLHQLHHELALAIAREHMDHDMTVRLVDNDDGSTTLSIEY